MANMTPSGYAGLNTRIRIDKKPIKNPRADYAQIIERGYNNDKY